MTALDSRGKSLWDTLHQNLTAYMRHTGLENTTRAYIGNVQPQGTFVGGMTADAFFKRATETLVTCGQVYRWEDTLYFEISEPDHQQLLPLATNFKAESGSAALVANLICVGVEDDKSMTQSIPPAKLVNALLANRDLWRRSEKIHVYARRPVFDDNYNLCGPGWHADKGILVHGPAIVPVMPTICRDPSATALDRWPLLRGLLREFCFQSEADMINYLSMLLTGVLINHFIDDPHPGFLIDGNQPGLGKTILIQAAGQILDGAEPPRIPLGKDEELEKRLCAQLRSARSSIFFFDNLRGHIESALIEANILSPILVFRILGQNVTITRPNTYLWAGTGNLTSATSDYLRRTVPIRFFFRRRPQET